MTSPIQRFIKTTETIEEIRRQRAAEVLAEREADRLAQSQQFEQLSRLSQTGQEALLRGDMAAVARELPQGLESQRAAHVERGGPLASILMAGIGEGDLAKQGFTAQALKNIPSSLTPALQQGFATQFATGQTPEQFAIGQEITALPQEDKRRAARGKLGLELLEPDLANLNLQADVNKEELSFKYATLSLQRMLGLREAETRELVARMNMAATMTANETDPKRLEKIDLVRKILEDVTDKNKAGASNSITRALFVATLDDALTELGALSLADRAKAKGMTPEEYMKKIGTFGLFESITK